MRDLTPSNAMTVGTLDTQTQKVRRDNMFVHARTHMHAVFVIHPQCALNTELHISTGTCTSCGAGTFKPSPGAATCDTCPSNSNSPVGSLIATACTCNAGSSGPDGGTCSLCVAGKHKELAGSTACVDCEVGTYSASVGATQ